jgi:hypothetical protein
MLQTRLLKKCPASTELEGVCSVHKSRTLSHMDVVPVLTPYFVKAYLNSLMLYQLNINFAIKLHISAFTAKIVYTFITFLLSKHHTNIFFFDLTILILLYRNRGSSVSIVFMYGLDDIRSPAEAKDLTSVSRPALVPTQPTVQWVPGVLSPGAKRGRCVKLTPHPPSSAEVVNE